MTAYEDGNSTIINLTVPGMWVEDVEENGEIYQSLEIPDYLTLMDVGLPAIPAIGGYVGYNAVSDMSINYTDDMTIDLENYNVYPFQEPDTDNDLFSYPFTINDNLYEKDMWYPLERVNVEDTEIMRDVPVSHFGVVPFQYNPLTKLLRVHPEMTITITHTPNGKGGFEGKSEGDADPTFIGMYESLIVNYGNLGLQPIETSVYDYLIVTHPNFETQANDLANYLHNTFGYSVYVDSIATADWNVIYDRIKKFYEGYRNDYVLLIGDTDYIPIAYKYGISSDMVYSCLRYDDDIPDIALGRLSVTNSTKAQLQVNKIKCHYMYGLNHDRMLKSLLVAHLGRWQDTGELYPFEKCKERVCSHNYIKYTPYLTFMPGRSGWKNQDVINYVNEYHYMFINYRGHGSRDAWAGWTTDKEDPDFDGEDIDQINPGNERPVVFSICCDTGYILQSECFCERWMNIQGGAVGIIGATFATTTTSNSIFDEWLYRVMYDNGEKHLGLIVNWAKLEMLKTLYFSDYSEGLLTHYAFVLLGDPSLEVVPLMSPGKGYITMNDKSYKRSLNNNNLNPEVTVYPNPSYDVFNIVINNFSDNYSVKLYDISGRLIYSEDNRGEGSKNTIKIDPINLGMSQGVYYISVSSDDCNIIKRILYIKE
jgi:hypothetical protein